MELKKFLKKELKKPSRRRFLNFLDDIRALGSGSNLSRLAKVYRSDKGTTHFYTKHYQQHFQKLRYRKINLLEIGVGGYSYSHLGGNSLRMWKKFFPFGKIFAFDIHDKTAFEEKRIRIFQGSQTNLDFLEKVVKEIRTIDIIIDDGSHQNDHVITTFKFLFPKLKEGGWYVIEDTQTSYWENFGGDSQDLSNPATTMNYFKALTDSLNYIEFPDPEYVPNYYDKNIIGIHFYHNIIFLQKGSNNERSNIVGKK